MQTNNLFSFFADPTSITLHDAVGQSVARVFDGNVEPRAALRDVEWEHLHAIAADFERYHAVAFADENPGKQLMPILK